MAVTRLVARTLMGQADKSVGPLVAPLTVRSADPGMADVGRRVAGAPREQKPPVSTEQTAPLDRTTQAVEDRQRVIAAGNHSVYDR
jgi:hypothetical protein